MKKQKHENFTNIHIWAHHISNGFGHKCNELQIVINVPNKLYYREITYK